MNALNLKTLGEKKLICDPDRQVQEFMLKIKLFIIQINNFTLNKYEDFNCNSIKLAAKSMRKIEETLLLWINLESIFSFYNVPLNLMSIILSCYKS